VNEGLWPSHWPAEDGGPRREQWPVGSSGLAIRDGEGLRLAAARDAFATTMVVARDPGEVFALRHTMGSRPLHDPSRVWIERIDPDTLAPLARSPELAGGPFWPGGLAAHANGSLHVVFGRHCHRLSPELSVLATFELPRPRAYNSFVVLADGTLVMKDVGRETTEPALVTLLDPDTLERRAADTELPEPSVARLSADGDALYAVGTGTVWRYRWDGIRLERDRDWEFHYHGGPDHSYGWDPVISGGHLWLLDNGDHAYTTTMRGAGLAPGPVRLLRASLDDPVDHEGIEVSGLPRGTVTDPPLCDASRRIAIGYDSGNGVVRAFRFGSRLEPLWRRELDHAAHMILYPGTGELVMHDFHGPAFAHTRFARALGGRWSGPARSARVRRALGRRFGDDVVVLDIETGAERGRARVPSMFQSVLFPAPGFRRDLYWCTFSTLARLEVA
jgi:sugar lactone lactonase YvrE